MVRFVVSSEQWLDLWLIVNSTWLNSGYPSCKRLQTTMQRSVKDPPVSKGKLTISMAIVNSYGTYYQRLNQLWRALVTCRRVFLKAKSTINVSFQWPGVLVGSLPHQWCLEKGCTTTDVSDLLLVLVVRSMVLPVAPNYRLLGPWLCIRS